MSYQVTQSTTAFPLVFFMADSTDKTTGKTGLSPMVTISKAGGSFGSPAGSVSEIANGWYKVAGNATDSNTLGPLILHATGTAADPVDMVFEVVAINVQDAVRGGLTALPNAAADAAGGLPISDAGGLDLDAKIGALTFTVANKVDANATHLAGTSQTGRDIGASVLLSSGTGTGQLKLASGYVAMTWADIAAPTTSVNLSGTTIATTQKVDVETIKTNPVVNGGTLTFPSGATLASTTNITGGTITTATNLTNAPGAGDFTATMKTSIGTAVAASAVASVTGNVGGNVTGSVGSLATQAKADVNAEVDTAISDAALLAADTSYEATTSNGMIVVSFVTP